MAFAGITELWNASLCLFHRTFGGPLASDELALVRQGAGHAAPAAPWREAASRRPRGLVVATGAAAGYAGGDDALRDVDGAPFVDALDEIVYEAALARFEHELREAGVPVDV